MLSKNFLKQSSFCVLGASSVSLVQSSVGFTDNNQSLIPEKKALQISAGNKDLMDKNLRLMEGKETTVETEPQEKNGCKTLEECFVRYINSENFKGFLGKIYLALKLTDIIPAYLTLKIEELLKVGEWPEVLAIIGFVVVRGVFYAFLYAFVFFTYVFALLGLFVGLKYLGQKSKEGISNFINAINNSQGNAGDAA